MRLKLHGVSGPYAGETFEIGEEPIIIGRNPSAAHIVLPINALAVSGKHVAVWLDKKRNVCMVEDFSTNGTFKVSGERIPKDQPIAFSEGERFYLGNVNCVFEVQIEDLWATIEKEKVVQTVVKERQDEFYDGMSNASIVSSRYRGLTGQFRRFVARIIDRFF
ncbi:MAG: hypothetical protein H6Q73_50 [Firmicutes bacterium]|nr:hypothetical protein [Bacillota bacterium]